ncbi:MAG: MerR family transcriptional regulator [Nitrospinae bacterium]|nr:MerR family transcriptional regulator [Nitrospinota bacterium]MCH7649733.1 MerR family transcriptional regulator [Nitrospinota bacterium]TDJ50538.1 MAG: MerR family transcriptional regulator [Nitrospina sp.]
MNQPIPDKLFFKIGEVAEIAGVEQHVLRYWEDEFDVLKPNKNKSGQRLFQKKDIDQVLEIKQLLYTDKFTIAGAKKKLKQKRSNDGGSQMNFGFDREALADWKKKATQDLQSILNILDQNSK